MRYYCSHFVDNWLALVVKYTLIMPLTLGTNEVQEICIPSEDTGLAGLSYIFMLGSLDKFCAEEVLNKTGDVIYIQDKTGLSYISLYDDVYNHGLVITYK